MLQCRYKGYHIQTENGESCIFTPQGRHVETILVGSDDRSILHAKRAIRERISENRDKPVKSA